MFVLQSQEVDAAQLLRRRKIALDLLKHHPQHSSMAEALGILGVDGMSDADDGEEPDVWRIKTMQWRSNAVTMWLRSLDAYEYDAALAQHSVRVRDMRGGRRSTRIAGGGFQPLSERRAVSKLNAAAYSKTWLDSLDDGRRYSLEINQQGFDFSFPIPKFPYKVLQ